MNNLFQKSNLYDETVDKIIDCCKRITEADPHRDSDAEKELHRIGETAYSEGREDHMRGLVEAAMTKARLQGRTWGLGALCNSEWHGIGDWRR